VTRVSNNLKRHTLFAFHSYDILDCIGQEGDEINDDSRVFEYLYFNESARVREFMMSFLNALSSEFHGRTYLL